MPRVLSKSPTGSSLTAALRPEPSASSRPEVERSAGNLPADACRPRPANWTNLGGRAGAAVRTRSDGGCVAPIDGSAIMCADTRVKDAARGVESAGIDDEPTGHDAPIEAVRTGGSTQANTFAGAATPTTPGVRPSDESRGYRTCDAVTKLITATAVVARVALTYSMSAERTAKFMVPLTSQTLQISAGPRCIVRVPQRRFPATALKRERGLHAANPFERQSKSMVPPPRLERGTPRSTIWCSNQLSYGGIGAGCIVEAPAFQAWFARRAGLWTRRRRRS